MRHQVFFEHFTWNRPSGSLLNVSFMVVHKDFSGIFLGFLTGFLW